MNEELTKARRILLEQELTCVICRGDEVYTTTARGVTPLVRWLESDLDLAGGSAADKVVGKATAFLYRLLGVKAVYAGVMSTAAMEVLRAGGIEVQCGKEVPGIINRRGDGPCPFEEAVWEIHDPLQALAAIRAKQAQMGLR